MSRPQGEGWEPKSNFIVVGGGGTSCPRCSGLQLEVAGAICLSIDGVLDALKKGAR